MNSYRTASRKPSSAASRGWPGRQAVPHERLMEELGLVANEWHTALCRGALHFARRLEARLEFLRSQLAAGSAVLDHEVVVRSRGEVAYAFRALQSEAISLAQAELLALTRNPTAPAHQLSAEVWRADSPDSDRLVWGGCVLHGATYWLRPRDYVMRFLNPGDVCRRCGVRRARRSWPDRRCGRCEAARRKRDTRDQLRKAGGVLGTGQSLDELIDPP